MAKPKRKYLSVSAFEGSVQAMEFLALLIRYLGEQVVMQALETIEEKYHVFAIAGSQGQGLMVEVKEEAKRDFWVRKTGLIIEDPEGRCVTLAKLTSHSWDPWLHAKLTGDESFTKLPAAKRRAVSAEKSAVVAAKYDRVDIRIVPKGMKLPQFLGLASDLIDAVKGRHEVAVGSVAFVGPPRTRESKDDASLKKTRVV